MVKVPVLYVVVNDTLTTCVCKYATTQSYTILTTFIANGPVHRKHFPKKKEKSLLTYVPFQAASTYIMLQ